MRFASLILVFLSLRAGAQLEKDYRPLQPSAAVPAYYAVDIKTESEALARSNKLLPEKKAKDYYCQVLAAKKAVLESGDIYLPNQLSFFIDSIGAALLKTEPSLENKIHFYLTRQSSANAFCLPDGSIFINLGLINTMESESELAFVMAHEIAHFHQQHSIKDYVKENEISRRENYSNGSGSEFRKLRLSRESEQEADSYALSMMNAAGYDIQQATTALMKLKPKGETELIDYKSIFSNSFFTLDSVLLTREMIDKVKEVLKSKLEGTDEDKLDDLYETHPDLDKRIGTLNELLRNMRQASKRNSGNYQHYKSITAFEMCHNYLREQDYINAALQVIRLRNQYPDNHFLISTMGASLYWLSYYKELSKNDLRVYGNFQKDPLNFTLMYLMFDKMSLKSSKQLAYAWLRSREESIEHDDNAFFLLAAGAENYLGKTAARDFYRRYNVNFPTGEHITFVKNKLQ